MSLIANHISHRFNLHGPSIAIDTMSSSSMTAVHLAREALLRGECDLAIAGGINFLHPQKYIGSCRMKFLGSSAGSRSFCDGNGYLPAECVGAMLLKPLGRAVADADDVLAAIKSTAANHGGANGFMVPNPLAQAQLIEDVLRSAQVDPRTVSYVEAAAYGSALGDAAEIVALSNAFAKFTGSKGFCALGSVKSNMGHAEAASGFSQLSKVVLQLRHRQLVPVLRIAAANPHVDLASTPFRLADELQPWRRPTATVDGETREFPRRALVNSFGAGGSYAAAVLEEYVHTESEVAADAANRPHRTVPAEATATFV